MIGSAQVTAGIGEWTGISGAAMQNGDGTSTMEYRGTIYSPQRAGKARMWTVLVTRIEAIAAGTDDKAPNLGPHCRLVRLLLRHPDACAAAG